MKKEFTNSVAKVILDLGFTIFGGYVRDMFSGDDAADIDVLCGEFSSLISDNITKALMYKGMLVGVNKNKGLTGSLTKYEFSNSTVVPTEHLIVYDSSNLTISVEVDLVFAESVSQFQPDFEVNKLELSSNGVEQTVRGTKLFRVIDQARRKSLGENNPSSIPQKRINKMLHKGWKFDE